MKGHLRQHSPGSWELSVNLGRDAIGQPTPCVLGDRDPSALDQDSGASGMGVSAAAGNRRHRASGGYGLCHPATSPVLRDSVI
jgi:hypothetical protein